MKITAYYNAGSYRGFVFKFTRVVIEHVQLMSTRVDVRMEKLDKKQITDAFTAVKGKHEFNFDLSGDQLTLIEAVLNGRDALGVLPTGAGKSMCFILPPLLKSHIYGAPFTALVVSPLLALSTDQVTELRKRRITACMLGSSRGSTDFQLRDLQRGGADIIFASPEMMQVDKWQRILRTVYGNKICVQVFDEAHCISEWGNDFRPAYRDVTEIRSQFNCPSLALTATINKRIHRDLQNVLCLTPSTVVVAVLPDRPNIFLSMRNSSHKYEEELRWVEQHLQDHGIEAKKIIIYCRSVSQCSIIFQWLWSCLGDKAYCGDHVRQNRIIEMFHAHVDDEVRLRISEEFPKVGSVIRVVVCTIAFGMGVDIPDVRAVVLWGLPKTLLQYWQETGRCCRDKKYNGISVCYNYPVSFSTCTDATMKDVAKARSCLREAVLEEFKIDGMKGTLPVKNNCSGTCEAGAATTCACDFCSCCDRCALQCQCEYRLSAETIPADFFRLLP